MKKRLWVGGLALVAASGITLGYLSGRARAAGVPAKTPMSYSGVLTDTAGTPLTGSKNIQVVFWDDPTDGTAQCTVSAGSQPLVAGSFRVPLSDGCTNAVHGYAELWVEVVVDGTSLGRTKLGAVPYALEADTATNAGGALDDRIRAIENAPTPKFQVANVGYVPCQPLTNLRIDGKNALIREGLLYSDSSCTKLVSGTDCHPICAALSVSNPEVSPLSDCCGVNTYYTKGLVEITAYQ
jgi:hypothetical protein